MGFYLLFNWPLIIMVHNAKHHNYVYGHAANSFCHIQRRTCGLPGTVLYQESRIILGTKFGHCVPVT